MAEKKKIYLAPSNQSDNTYYGGKTNEAKECQAIAEITAKQLKDNGFEVKVGAHEKSLYQKAQEANAWGADAYIAIHSNGSKDGKARGTEGWYYTGSTASKKLAGAVYNPVEKLVGNGRGLKNNKEFQDLKQPKMASTILEIGFHDNKEDAAYIIGHHEEIAAGIAEGVCTLYGVDYKEPGMADSDNGLKALYKVRIDSGLNLRTGPGTTYQKIGFVGEGKISTIYDTNADKTWGYNGSGWHSIKVDYVTKQ